MAEITRPLSFDIIPEMGDVTGLVTCFGRERESLRLGDITTNGGGSSPFRGVFGLLFNSSTTS